MGEGRTGLPGSRGSEGGASAKQAPDHRHGPRGELQAVPRRRARAVGGVTPASRAWVLAGTSAILLAGCGQGAAVRADAAETCRLAQPSTTLDAAAHESSGVAVSRRYPGVVWTHNDSGGEPVLFAVDAAGQLLGQLPVPGARNVDWEDIALARCGQGYCLYLADTGDNDGRRESVDLYRLPEPDPVGGSAAPAERFPVRFPEGPRDVESLFVLPNERIFFVTRGRSEPVAIYAYPEPLRPAELVELALVRNLSAGPVPIEDQVTAADASADGEWVLLRTWRALLFYSAEDLLRGMADRPLRVDLSSLGEPQGEGLGVGERGAVVLSSEGAGAGLPGALTILWCSLLAP